jgi:hypothetical protein
MICSFEEIALPGVKARRRQRCIRPQRQGLSTVELPADGKRLPKKVRNSARPEAARGQNIRLLRQ